MSTKHDADVIVAGAGPGGRDRGAASRARRRSRADRRALRAAATEAVRRRHQHARALTVSLSAGDALKRIPTLPGVGPVSRRPVGRRLPHAVGRARGPADPPDRVRSPARRRSRSRPARGSWHRRRSRRRRQDADGVTLTHARRPRLRAPMVIAADGVNSVIARRLGLNPGWPDGPSGARHDGGDADRRRFAPRSRRRWRCSTGTAARTATPTSSRSAVT